MSVIARWMRLGAAALFGTGALLVGLLLTATPAHATSSGPCQATINGIDVADRSATDPDQAVTVHGDGAIVVVVSSPQPIGHYEVQLWYAGFTGTVAEGDAGDTSWTRTLDVGDYATFGSGLYQVRFVSHGDITCTNTVLIDVDDSPLGTVGGWVAIALGGLGVAGVVLAAVRSKGGIPVRDMAFGAMGGVGVVGLSQQFSIAYPTPVFAAVSIGAGAVIPYVAHQLAGLGGHGTSGIGSTSTSGTHAPHTPESSGMHAGQTPEQGVGSGHLVHTPETGSSSGVAGVHAQIVHNHVVGPIGLQTFGGPDPSSLVGQTIDPGVQFRVLQTVGERALIECSNGWKAWVAVAAIVRAVN